MIQFARENKIFKKFKNEPGVTWTEKRYFKPYSGYFCYILANKNFDSTENTLFEEYQAIKNFPL